MNESGFIKYIFKKLPPKIYKLKINLAMQNGVPDTYFSGPAGDCWIEFKYIVAPKRKTTSILPKLSALQIQWLDRRHHEGRTVAVVLGSDIGCFVYSNQDWAVSISNKTLRQYTRQDVIKWIESKTLD